MKKTRRPRALLNLKAGVKGTGEMWEYDEGEEDGGWLL